MLLRRSVWGHSLLKDRLANYTVEQDKPREWTKMSSAQRHDKPRWRDYPEKMKL